MRFLDLFAGIGGFRTGMEKAGHECVGYVEIDKYARKSYEAIHNTEGEWTRHDITAVTDSEWRELRGEVDIICGGFPCQAFSIAGNRRGFDDTRGTLFFEIARAAKQIQPPYLLLENVKGLLSHDKGRTFETILQTLDELGYDAQWEVLNSKNFGVPQNRERVFIIGYLRGESRREIFPIGDGDREINRNDIVQLNDSEKIRKYLGYEHSSRVFSDVGIAPTVSARDYKGPILIATQEIKQVGNIFETKSFGGNPQRGRVYGIDGISPSLNTCGGGGLEPKVAIPVLTPDRMEKRQNGRRFKDDGEPMFTLTGQDRHGVVISEATKKGYDVARPGDSVNMAVPGSKTRRGRVGKGVANTLETSCNQGTVTESLRIRKLTPLECWRLQGFTDEQFKKAKAVNSNSQLYKQAGNSVTVNVVYEIARRLK